MKDTRTATGADSYPSLYATLTPESTPEGARGFRVTCTATHNLLGFVWWSCAGRDVTWHYCAADGHVGERTTKRNAVQALRDVQLRRFADAPVPTTTRPTPRATTPKPTPKPTTPAAPALPTTRIQWTRDNVGGDLRDSVSRSLTTHTKKEQR